MPETLYKLQYTVSEETKNEVAVIVVCGGSSSRMGNADKMLLTIDNVPVFVRSVLAFQNNSNVKKIIIVSRAENLLFTQNAVDKYNLYKVTDIVTGGKSRQESVKNGFERLSDEDKVVLIHDGARPFVSNECIDRVVDGAKKYGAVTCAVKCKDTIKEINSDGQVVNTPDRNNLVAVQTPQGFRTEIYRQALSNCEDLSFFTDDCSVVENAGYKVYVVEGEYKNIKITTPEDIKIAECFKEDDE